MGRLAVSKTCQRQGIGKTLLVAAMGRFIEIFNSAAGIGATEKATGAGL
jgi:ribosomal protein S18 acetylase RimI-like enzyme